MFIKFVMFTNFAMIVTYINFTNKDFLNFEGIKGTNNRRPLATTNPPLSLPVLAKYYMKKLVFKVFQ